MIFAFILLISVLQFCLYAFCDFRKWRYGKATVSAIIVLAHFFVFPGLFFPEESDMRCGLPEMAITFGFWIFGSIATIITFLLYHFTKRMLRKK